MKNKSIMQSWMPSALAALALSAAVGVSSPVITVNTYDTSTSLNGVFSWYGGATVAWDGTQDHDGNSGGSLYISHAAGAGDHIYCPECFAGDDWDTGTTYDLTTYTNLSLWVKWDTNYSTMPIGDFNSIMGGVEVHLVDDSSGQYGSLGNGSDAHSLPNQLLSNTASNGWVHLNFPIANTIPNINLIGAIIFDTGYYHSSPWTGDCAFWVDDITLQPSAVDVIPPPVVSPLAKPAKGLDVIFGSAGLYDRHEGRLIGNTGKSWVGHATVANPVTYSFTIDSFPSAPATYGASAYMFLSPNPAANDGAPDYNESNCAIAFVQQGSTNATLVFQYKVNDAYNNSMQYGSAPYTNAVGSWDGVTPNYLESGNLGFVTTLGSAVGTWTIKFTSDTNITLTAPDNTTTNVVLPTYNAGYFAETTAFNVYLGGQPDNSASINQGVVYSSFSITGTATPFSENFLTDTVLDTTNVWDTTPSSSPNDVIIVPATAKYWASWTLPASGFSLQAGTNLNNEASWNTLTKGPLLTLIGIDQQLVDSSELPAGKTAFFNLIKRTFTQLQILLPGETNAPGTMTGKTGSPTPVSLGAGGQENVTVNSVDSTFHIVSGSFDNIHLTTTDGSAITPLDQTLSGGTVSFSGGNAIVFGTQGSWTVTATDTTSATVTNAVISSPVTVGP